MRRLYLVMFPLILGFGAYQLIYVPQKGWYGWLTGTLASCAYAGGFVTMTPQVFRNYKLKSVAHLPWTALFYQFVNTFVDDVFALVMRMPDMHRMSVVRDDVVFIVFIFQRWLYGKRRVEDEEGEEMKKEGGGRELGKVTHTQEGKGKGKEKKGKEGEDKVVGGRKHEEGRNLVFRKPLPKQLDQEKEK
eukprot:GHVT01076349.1.p1 GENE.GHVT01076349.1~~GHVT01076349.1.p1  ORF type:complete len:189 (-),score=30.39 GHVT01076349.1:44-610(-)